MTRTIRSARSIYVAAFALFFLLPSPAKAQSAAPAILDAGQAGKLLPSSVYFDGQSATTQLRNSAGIRFSDGQLTLAVLVDTSGYSAPVAQKYQGYLVTGVPLSFHGLQLRPGAYGIGVTDGALHVMDIGNHELLRASATRDAAMHRPVPLQILAGPAPGTYRLCLGRECIQFRRAN